MLKGAQVACYLTDVHGQPGESFLCTVYVRGKVSRAENVSLTIKWRTAEGAWFEEAPTQSVPLPQAELDEWTPLGLIFTMPEGAGRAVIMLSADGMEPDEAVWFDDCSVKQLRAE